MARYFVTMALLIGLMTSNGCCWMADRWCPHPQPVAYPGYPAGYGGCPCNAPPTGCGCPSYAPGGPPPNWVQPQPQPQAHPAYCPCQQ